MSQTAEKSTALTPQQERPLDAAVAIRESEPAEDEKAFLTRYLV